MKNIVMCAMAAIAVLMSGCKTPPTVEKMTAVATVVGKTAGYACELSKMKPEVKEAISKVLDVVSTVVPTNRQTFVEAWTPVVDKELDKLVAAGKIDEGMKNVASTAMSAACLGIDYVFTKHPKAKNVEELASAATTGFIAGYRSVINFAAVNKLEIDYEAYAYLKAELSARK